MTAYVITGEFNGIQNECLVFTNEEKAISVFEEKSGCPWQDYLNGEYKFQDDGSLYRFFECEMDGEE